jgi:hypothetical protein
MPSVTTGDHIHAFHLLAGDKGRWFIVGISGTGAYRGYKFPLPFDDVAVPVFGRPFTQERHHIMAALNNGERVKANQFACMVCIAITGARISIGDVAHHRTGIAADLFRFNVVFHCAGFPLMAAWTALGVAGTF